MNLSTMNQSATNLPTMKLSTMKLSVVVPCYNEADNVDKLHDELLPILERLVNSKLHLTTPVDSVELILVDDGSRDGTYSAFKQRFAEIKEPWLTIQILQHTVNRGLGAAIRTGLGAATGDIIVTTDSDGTYRFEEIPRLLACLTPQVSIVTASPYHPEGSVMNVPAHRLLFSRGSSLLYRILVSWKIHTYTALFRAYRREVVQRITFESDGFLAGTELMVNAMMEGYQVAEYPTTLHSRVNGVSKAKIIRTIRAHLKFQAEILLRRLGIRRTNMVFNTRQANTR
jgi:dolichol-phosphate mannosyltransferase